MQINILILEGGFLFLVVILLSLGVGSTTYARERNGSSRNRDKEYTSRGYREKDRSRNSGGWGGPKLNYDGRTSGIGKNLGRGVGATVGGAIGSKYGGKTGEIAGRVIGGYAWGKAGDSLERRGNKSAHDRWNSRGSKGHSWRMSKDEEIFEEKLW